jgi:hypothetical protein
MISQPPTVSDHDNEWIKVSVGNVCQQETFHTQLKVKKSIQTNKTMQGDGDTKKTDEVKTNNVFSLAFLQSLEDVITLCVTNSRSSRLVTEEVIDIVVSSELTWVGRLITLQGLMKSVKRLQVTGSQKKYIVKRVFLLVVNETVHDQIDKLMLSNWIDQDAELMIDNFVELAPKLFKMSTWNRILKNLERCLGF